MTSEIERIKILEGKIAHVIEYISKLSAENDKLKQQLKELRNERKDMEEAARRAGKLDEDIKKYENEREAIKAKIEAIINQIDKLGL